MGGEEVAQAQAQAQAHVLLLPLPLQGPVNCFLKLAHLLSSDTTHHLHITVVNAAFIRHRLPDLPSRFPRVRFVDISDGIDGDHPRPPSEFSDMVRNFEAEFVSRLTELVPATCLIADGVFQLAGKKAMEMGIPVVYFSTLSPSCVWASCRFVPDLVDHGHLPFTTGNLNDPVTNIPGSEAAIRRRDLPGICRAQDIDEPYVQLILRECRELPFAQGHILNTYDQLEGTPLLSQLRSLFPNLYTIGPIHSLLKTRQNTHTDTQTGQCSSFWKEDRSCLEWLDQQPSNSVLFVSFGSIISLTLDQITEFWYGLVNSGVRFLWVQRPNSSVGPPENVQDGEERGRGRVVSWAPQEEVLAHRAVGGFLTHSGWNSTLESVAEGVPMICWPRGIDQLVISRFVEEDWRIGIDMKDKCDRVVIEFMVRELMEKNNEVYFEKARVLAKLGSEAVNEGGSSWCALDRLIEDIKFMRLPIPPSLI